MNGSTFLNISEDEDDDKDDEIPVEMVHIKVEIAKQFVAIEEEKAPVVSNDRLGNPIITDRLTKTGKSEMMVTNGSVSQVSGHKKYLLKTPRGTEKLVQQMKVSFERDTISRDTKAST